MKELNCHLDLCIGFELALDQLGYEIVKSEISECGIYQYYWVEKEEE